MKDLAEALAEVELSLESLRRCNLALRRVSLQKGSPLRDLEKMAFAVATEMKVKPLAVLGKSRVAKIALARHIVWWIARNIWEMKLERIGELWQVDHTAIIYGCQRITKKRLEDPAFRTLTNVLITATKPFAPR